MPPTPVNLCSVEGCTIGRDPDANTTYHSFPQDPYLREEWAKFCKDTEEGEEVWEPGPGKLICSYHFRPDDFIAWGIRRLKPQAVPTRRECVTLSKCVVPGCGNTKKNNPYTFFYCFPKDPDMLRVWCESIFGNEIDLTKVRNGKVCGDHFTRDCIEPVTSVLKEHAVPRRWSDEEIMVTTDVNNEEMENVKVFHEYAEDGENEEYFEEAMPDEETDSVYEAENEEDFIENFEVVDVSDNVLKSLSSVCRICLIEGDVTKISDIFAWEGVPVPHILRKYAKIDVDFDDRLPQSICETCLTQLHNVYTFLSKCEYSEKYLKKLINDQMLSESNVKTEPEQDITDHEVNNVEEDEAVEQHESLSETDEQLNSADRQSQDGYRCEPCKEDFTSQADFDEHVKSHQEDSPEQEIKIETTQKSDEEESYQCSICGKALKNRATYNNHMAKHKPRMLPCDQCNKMFPSKEKLHRHIYYVHTGEKYVCSSCGLSFKYAQQYKDHMDTHEEHIACNLCNKEFSTKRSLMDHMNLHEESARIKCHICQKPLRSNGHLKIHLRTHTGEKPFGCNICGKKFAQKTNMIMHRITHESAGLYECERCGTDFTDVKTFRKHISRNDCERGNWKTEKS